MNHSNITKKNILVCAQMFFIIRKEGNGIFNNILHMFNFTVASDIVIINPNTSILL